MKISVVCLCVFLFCTLYWAFGTSLILVSTENEASSSSISASIPSENATGSTKSDSELNEHVVIKSDSDLEPSADTHSSIEDIANEESGKSQQQEYAFVETVSQNSGVAHEVAGTGSGVIHTLVDSATLELQEKAEELSAAADASATPSHHNETPSLAENNLTRDKSSVLINKSLNEVDKENISVEIKLEQGSEKVSNNTQQTDQPATEVPSIEPKSNLTEQQGEAHEDIPSFSEWTQKQLEEAERKKEQVNSSAQTQQTNGKSTSSNKKRWKNYASPDCGAKIIAANPEAISAGSVLAASRDEYKLNTCTSRIWFIVELCEAIQAKKIDLANFELFSSSPKDFSIYVSDRFPSRDWSSVGHFTAKDERDIQSFDLHPHLFGKFIKFEMHSHHGSEHYCPISLFRVYGTSEFEVLETENQVQPNAAEEDDDDETLDADDDGVTPKNLFSSATDAVISIVKKAAEVLGNKGNTSTNTKDQQNVTVEKYTPLISTCTTPSHIVVCDNCSDLLFGNVFELLSCNSKELVRLVNKPIIKNALYNSDICAKYGLEFRTKATSTTPSSYKSYMNSFFPPKLIVALCNTVAVNECKVVRNISSSNTTTILTPQDVVGEKILNTKIGEPTMNLEGIAPDAADVFSQIPPTEEPITTAAETNTTEYTLQIKPTKTLTPEEDLNLTDASIMVEPPGHEQTVHPTDSFSSQTTQNDSAGMEDKPTTQHVEHIEVSSEVVADMETAAESSESLEDHLESLVTELNGDSTANVAAATISPPTMPPGQKESVFLRLSNRIKALERNMSLSSQYLEELSRRYKKQVEEMQRLLDKTINTLNEENKKKEERTQRLEEQIMSLKDAVESLIVEKNSWIHTTYWIFLTGITVLGILLFCRRNQEFKQPTDEERAKNSEVQRRKSVDVITHKTPVKKKRRPSEEALLIAGTYTDLLIDEVDASGQKSKEKKRRKKKQLQQLQRSNSITTLNEEVTDDDPACRTVSSEKGFRFTPKLTSSQIWKRQESAPPNLPTDWVDDSYKLDRIQDIPFVLEESEHTSLEPLSYPVLSQKSLSNGEKRRENGNAVHSTFAVTAVESRSKRIFNKQKNGSGKKSGHKKSASFDETKRHKTPSPVGTDATSLSNSFEEPNQLGDVPKKEKKSTLKKLFKNFNFK